MSDVILSHNHRHVTLFTFVYLYSKKWKLTGVKKVPHFIPNFTNIPKRSGKHEQRYVLFLRATMLEYKAGTTLLHIEVLSKEGLEQTASDFCTTHPPCTNIVLQEHEQSQQDNVENNENKTNC